MKKTPLDQRINYRLGMLSHRWSALIVDEARRRHRLNTAAIKLLSVIARFAPVSPGELMTHTSFDSPKIARTLAALTEAGLVQREIDPADGRRAMVQPTARGQSVNDDVEREAVRVEREITESLSGPEREALLALLDKLEQGLRAPRRAAKAAPRPSGKGEADAGTKARAMTGRVQRKA